MTARMELQTEIVRDAVPIEARERLAEFLLDKRTGNLTLHIKSGKVMGFALQEQVKLD